MWHFRGETGGYPKHGCLKNLQTSMAKVSTNITRGQGGWQICHVKMFMFKKNFICLFWPVVRGQSPIWEEINAPECFNILSINFHWYFTTKSNFCKKKCQVTQGRGGGDEKYHQISHTGKGMVVLQVQKKCKVLFEWPLLKTNDNLIYILH